MNFKQLWYAGIVAVAVTVLASCASQPPVADFRVEVPKEKGKDIFIFLDGTGNSVKTPSNVRRVFDLAQTPGESKSAVVAFYVEGVGDPQHPVTGQLAGEGGTYRITYAYANLMRVYRPNDRVYIFGFSRGAHIARALAGMIAYAGLPVFEEEHKKEGFVAPHKFDEYLAFAENVNELTRGVNEDEAVQSYWSKETFSWKSLPIPYLAKNHLTDGLKNFNGSIIERWRPVPIEFVGVWDTVPGSLKREFPDCREQVAIGEGSKYKSNSYPTIKRISHAVSYDEMRSRFELMDVCKPIQWTEGKSLDGMLPEVTQVAFPGAHSDVGGGYVDENNAEWNSENRELPNISLEWMLQQLAKTNFQLSDNDIRSAVGKDWKPNPKGLAHWSLSGFKNTIPNHCEDRVFNDPRSPKDRRSVATLLDSSIGIRENAGPVPILKGERSASNPPMLVEYPVRCDEYESEFEKADKSE